MAQIAGARLGSFNSVKAFVEELVASGERVVNGEPDYSTVTVEMVELVGEPPYAEATVTVVRRDTTELVSTPPGTRSTGTGSLVAIRNQQTVELTPNGWLPSSLLTGLEQGDGITECPPPG